MSKINNNLSVKVSRIQRILLLIYSLIFILLNLIFSYSRLWKGIFQGSNVNKNLKAVDSVWYNPENGYHNDALIVSILNNKECIYSDNSPYSDYIIAFSKTAVMNSNVHDIGDSSIISLDDFVEVGYCLAYIHSTLVDHSIYERISEGKHDVPKLYVNTEDLSDTEKIVFLNDGIGNIYLMSENYWNDKNW